MSRFEFLGVIPRRVRLVSAVLGSCVAAAGLAVAIVAAMRDESAVALLAYSAAGVVGGLLISTWILGVGFVYADARRRAMRLWAVLVVLFPHLLGFLLYFVLRQPLASFCAHCGQTVAATQRFCSWCGAAQVDPVAATGGARPATDPGVNR